jgi:hypothetical protein
VRLMTAFRILAEEVNTHTVRAGTVLLSSCSISVGVNRTRNGIFVNRVVLELLEGAIYVLRR